MERTGTDETHGEPGGDDRLVYTVVEAAALLGISKWTAYELARKGVIPSVKLGTRVVVPRDALHGLLSTWCREIA